MKQLSIGQMIQKLQDTKLTDVERDFVRIFAEQSEGGKDTSKLNDKQVEMVAALYWGNCA